MSLPNPRDLLIVFVGGALGVGIRFTIEAAVYATPGSWPLATFAINIVGALALAYLYEFILVRNVDAERGKILRLGVGTGVLGGFTTYSTFALESARLLTMGAIVVGVGYAVLSVLLGVAAAGLGIWLARLSPRRGRA